MLLRFHPTIAWDGSQGGVVSHTAPLSRWWRVTFHQYVQFKRATVSVGVAHGFQGQSFNVESSGIFPLAAIVHYAAPGVAPARADAAGSSGAVPSGPAPWPAGRSPGPPAGRGSTPLGTGAADRQGPSMDPPARR